MDVIMIHDFYVEDVMRDRNVGTSLQKCMHMITLRLGNLYAKGMRDPISDNTPHIWSFIL